MSCIEQFQEHVHQKVHVLAEVKFIRSYYLSCMAEKVITYSERPQVCNIMYDIVVVIIKCEALHVITMAILYLK